MNKPSRRARIVDLIILAFLGGFLYWVNANKWTLSDWWALRDYQPSSEANSLAAEAGMSPVGRRLLYLGDPKLVGAENLGQLCGSGPIGCVTEQGQMYILQDEGGRYRDEIVTTAAHEMLHLAYRRLNRAERRTINRLVNIASQQLDGATVTRLNTSSDHAETLDELHSVLPTTQAHLPSELEEYYKRYFDDRAKTVASYRRSQSTELTR